MRGLPHTQAGTDWLAARLPVVLFCSHPNVSQGSAPEPAVWLRSLPARAKVARHQGNSRILTWTAGGPNNAARCLHPLTTAGLAARIDRAARAADGPTSWSGAADAQLLGDSEPG